MISEPGLRGNLGGAYDAAMSVTRIGKRHPAQVYIREWIAHRGLEQRQVAERMGIEPGTVSKLIRGNMRLTIEYLANFADALDVSVSDLFRHPDAPSRDELLAMGTPDQLRAALTLIKTMKTGTEG